MILSNALMNMATKCIGIAIVIDKKLTTIILIVHSLMIMLGEVLWMIMEVF